MDELKIAGTRKVAIGDYLIEERFIDGKYNATSLLRQHNDKTGLNRTMSSYIRNLSAKVCENDMSVVKLKSAHGRSLNEVWLKPLAFTKFVNWVMGDLGDDIVSDIIIREKLRCESEKAHKELMALIEEKCGCYPKNGLLARVEQGLICCVHGKYGRGDVGVESFATNDELLEKYALNVQIDFIIRNGIVTDLEKIVGILLDVYNRKYPKNEDKVEFNGDF